LGCVVAIYRLLAKTAFGPEETKCMGDAYELCLKVLRLKDRDDPITETPAEYILQIAQSGERDPRLICDQAIQRIRTAK
jgi:hypothetical protein